MSVEAADFFVSPDGDDTHDGRSVERPWRTLRHAALQLTPGDRCLIRAGIYRETVRPARSGEPGRPITFMPYENERVVIHGCDPISGWERQPDGVWRAPMPGGFFVSSMNQADQLFAGDRMLHEARWPDPTEHLSLPDKASFGGSISKTRDEDANLTHGAFEDERLPDWPDDTLVGAGIYVQPNRNAWSWTFSGVVTAQRGRQITFQSHNDSGKTGHPDTYDPKSRYFLYGHRALLDAPGEWWHDRDAGYVHLIPLEGVEPGRDTIQAKRRDYGFDLSERSHIRIQGLEMFACTITTDAASGGDGIGFDDSGKKRYPWRGKNSVATSRDVIIDGVTGRYLSHFTDVSGHFYLQWGQNSGIVLSGEDHIVRNCDLQYSAGNGITLLGRRHRALNNLIQDVNYLSTDCAAINTGGATVAEDHEIAFNTIRRCGRHGISYRKLTNSDPTRLRARIHHNDISRCMLQDWDGGGMYAAYDDHGCLRIDHNRIHSMVGYTVAGIYPDFCKNLIIDHNAVWNVEWAILLQGNKDGMVNALVHHNTLVVHNTSQSPYGPFGVAGGKGSKAGTDIRHNIIVSLDQTRGYQPLSNDVQKYAEQHGNLFAADASASGLTAPTRGDLTLLPDAAAIDAAEPLPDLERDGVVIPGCNDPANGLPDLGAYESGSPPWRAGCDLPTASQDAWSDATYPAAPR